MTKYIMINLYNKDREAKVEKDGAAHLRFLKNGWVEVKEEIKEEIKEEVKKEVKKTSRKKKVIKKESE